MSDWHRRSVLATGATLSIGGFASVGVGSEADDTTELPDPNVEPNPGMAGDDWPSFAGGAGHARFIEGGHEFDGDDLEVAWTANGESIHHGAASALSVAVADDTVYVTGTSSGPVGAYDAADGSPRWERDDLDVTDPSVVGDTVYVTGEELYALDVSDGEVRWQTEFAPEEPIESQTVAYGAAFVVADGTLYALETDDGSVRWEIDSVTVETGADGDEEEFDFHATTAAANGVIYASVGELVGNRPRARARNRRRDLAKRAVRDRKLSDPCDGNCGPPGQALVRPAHHRPANGRGNRESSLRRGRRRDR